MFNTAELLVSCYLTVCLAGYNVEVLMNSNTWHDAIELCTEQKSKLADITDIEMNNVCNRIDSKSESNMYWVGNFYKLSYRISIEGCYYIPYPTHNDGYHTLNGCFKLCSERMNISLFFAHRAVFGQNCICDLKFEKLHAHNSDVRKVLPYHCVMYIPFWVVYKFHLDDFHTDNETCRQLHCKESKTIATILTTICESNSSTNYDNLKSPISKEDLPYVCYSNETNRTYTNGTLSAEDIFRFGIYTSVKRELEDKPAIPLKCVSISCFRNFTIKIRLQNCSLKTDGFVCIKIESKNYSITSFTTKSSLKSSLNVSSVVQKTVNQNFHHYTRSILAQTKISRLPAVVNGNVQSESTRLQISLSAATKIRKPSSYVPIKAHILESITNGYSKPLVNCHSKIAYIIAGVLGATIVIIVILFLLVICWLRQKGPFKKKRIYEDIQVNELNISNYQQIDVHSDQSKRVAVQRVENLRH